jgi:hypothetical protein
MIPMPLGPIVRTPALRILVQNLPLERESLDSGLAKAGTDDDDGLHAFGDAIVDDAVDPRARHADHCQIDGFRNRTHCGETRAPRQPKWRPDVPRPHAR